MCAAQTVLARQRTFFRVILHHIYLLLLFVVVVFLEQQNAGEVTIQYSVSDNLECYILDKILSILLINIISFIAVVKHSQRCSVVVPNLLVMVTQ